MRSQLSDETDDEYFDDPIKLFDSEHDRVHFGSQVVQDSGTFEGLNISELKHSIEAVKIENNAESLGTIDSHCETFNVRDCLPVYIKLVDCSKYPWYYKKYTQQILDKIDICDLVSDSDNEIDKEHIEDTSDDCFIIDEIVNESKQSISRNSVPYLTIWPSVTLKTTAKKRQKSIKLKDQIEIQKALSQKHTDKIDFKRNKGLIGMTITKKYGKNTNNQTTAEHRVNKTAITEVKEKQGLSAKFHINSSDKVLNSIGTSSTAILIATENKTEFKSDVSGNHHASTSGVLIKKIPVQFSLEKKSEELVDRVIIKKHNEKCQNMELPDNKSNKYVYEQNSEPNLSSKISISTNKIKNYTKTVKNIKNTTKYKKKRLKIFENKLLELLAIGSNKKESLPYEAKKADKNVDGDKNTRKCIESNYEPTSPILPCSKLGKKNRSMNDSVKVLENAFKIGKRNNLTGNGSVNKADTVGLLGNKSMTGSFNNTGNMQITPKESKIYSHDTHPEINSVNRSNDVKKPLKDVQCNIALKSDIPVSYIQSLSSSHSNISTTQSLISMGHNVYNNLPTNSNVSSKPIQFCFTHPASVTSSIPNNSKNISNNILSSNNVVVSNQWDNSGSSINNKITRSSTATVVTTQCKPISSTNNRDNIDFINSYYLPIRDVSSNEPILNCLSNSPSYNSYTSAIILKPTQTKNITSGARFTESISNTPPGLPRFPVQMQPRFYHNPYKTNYYRPLYHQEQRFMPRITNSAMANYRFPSPLKNSLNSWHDPLPFSSSHFGGQMSNISTKWDPRSECYRDLYQSHTPISVLQTTTTSLNAKLGFASQPDYIAKPKMNIRQDYSSQVPNKKVDTVKIESQDFSSIGNKEDMLKSNANNVCPEENSDLVTSKTKMLELLDTATNELKIIINKDDNDTEKEVGDVFKRPKTSNKPEMTVEDYRVEIDQQKGYSPSILPIPTFENVLKEKEDVNVSKEIKYTNASNKRVLSDQSQASTAKRDIEKSKDFIYVNNNYNRVDGSKYRQSTRIEDIKKISLEEYKKRTYGYRSEDINKNIGEKYDVNKKRKIMHNKPKNGVDRRSTESDHGYDSDSTVIL